MSITLPDWAQTLPNSDYAPCPEAVARLHAPLAHLYPLLEAANTHSTTTTVRIPSCLVPVSTAAQSVGFHRLLDHTPSAHAALADPWMRPDTTALEQEVRDAAATVATILDPMFSRHLTARDNLKALGNRHGVALAIGWPHRVFDIPPGADCPLHMATLLVVLRRIFDSTPRPGGRIPSRFSPSYACPDWRGALKPRVQPLGRHMNRFFPIPVWG